MIDYLIRVWRAIKFEPTIVTSLHPFWNYRTTRRLLLPLLQLVLFVLCLLVLVFLFLPAYALTVGYPAKELGDDISAVLSFLWIKAERSWRPDRD